MPSLILGVGNVLLSDDGAGVHAARSLADSLAGRPDVQVLDGGTLSFSLAPLIEDADRLVLIDAAELGEAPGSVRCLFGEEIERFLGRARLSVHEVGLRDMLEIARLADALPLERALIGIQPATLDWGLEPSSAVAAGIAQAVQLALQLLEEWPVATAPLCARPAPCVREGG